MTADERIAFDVSVIGRWGLDSDEVDAALKRAGYDPDNLASYTLEQAREACSEEVAHRRMVRNLNDILNE